MKRIPIIMSAAILLGGCSVSVESYEETKYDEEDTSKMEEFKKYIEYQQFNDMARFLKTNSFTEENVQDIRLAIDEVSSEQKYPYRMKSLKSVDRKFFSPEVLNILDGIKDTSVEDSVTSITNEPEKTNPKIGMTREQVEESLWGKPNKINRTVTSSTVKEQWVYGSGQYLYFTDGIMTSFQD